MRILIVEDEPKTGAYLRKGLTEAGYVVDWVEDGITGQHQAETEEYDLLVLDVMLPGQDGWTLLQNLRRSKSTPVLFLMGASMAYFIAIPVALHFLLGFQGTVGGVQQEALPAIGNYLSFVMQFLFGFGLAFLLPVLLMLLERAGIVTRKQLIGARRYAIVGAFAISAVLTPPDIGSQVLLAVPLILLYGLSIVGIWFTRRRGQKAASEAA